MSQFSVATWELTRASGRLASAAGDLTTVGSTVGSTVGIPVGLPGLDGALSELAVAFGGWISQAGADLETLAMNTEAAGELYAEAEQQNASSAEPPACSNGYCSA
jgi:hypothetical protein